MAYPRVWLVDAGCRWESSVSWHVDSSVELTSLETDPRESGPKQQCLL